MKFHPAHILKAILATLIYLISIELLGAWALIAEALGSEDYYLYYNLVQGALQFLAVLTFTLIVQRRNLGFWKERIPIAWYLAAASLGVIFVFAQTPLNWLYNTVFQSDYPIEYNWDGLAQLLNPNTIAIILLAPIAEELFFRNYIQKYLERRNNALLALICSALLFALIHAPYMNLLVASANQDWHMPYMAFFGGVLSGTLYYKTKSLGPSILFHVFWNLTAFLL